MRCTRVQYLYEEYAAGLLPPETATRIDEHLTVCGECRDFFETNDDISQIIARCTEVAHPGEGYMENLSGRVISDLFDDSGAFRKAEAPPPEIELDHERTAIRPLWWAGGIAAAALFGLAFSPAFTSSDPRQNSVGQRHLVASAPAPAEPTPVRVELAAVGQTAFPDSPAAASLSKSARHAEEKLDRGAPRTAPRPAPSGTVVAQGAPPRPADPSLMQIDGGLDWARARQLPAETIEDMIVLQSMGTSDAHVRLQGMIEGLTARISNIDSAPAARGEEPLPLRQAALYWRAREQYENLNEPELAAKTYLSAIELNPKSKLAIRAMLGLAGLDFQSGRFADAQTYYRQVAAPSAADVISRTEAAEVAARLEQLDRFAANEWAALRGVHQVRHENWPEARAALERLAGDDAARPLLADAAQICVERLQSAEPGPGDHAVSEIIGLLEKNAALLEDGRPKAAIQMAIGDLYWFQFENVEKAFESYDKVLKIDRKGPSAEIAEKKLRQLRSQNLLRPVR